MNKLTGAWKKRLKLYAEGGKLCAEGGKLYAESNKLCAESNKLYAEGDKLWAEVVIEAYGNVTIEWKSPTHCIVNGEEFKEKDDETV